MASVFTKIIQGELPCYKIDEDQLTFSFLALDQIHLGHTLVVPKLEVDQWIDVPEEDYLQVHRRAKVIASAIRKATGCPRVGTIVAGFEVNHFHLHLIPAWGIPDLNFSKAKRRNDEEMRAIQSKILKSLF